MKRYLLATLIIGLFAAHGYCQGDQSTAGQNQSQLITEGTVAAPAEAEKVVQPQELSIYGEVKAANPATNSMTMQYYDYDSDEEKTIDIIIDSNTKMENAATINDIKQGNWADMIYAIADGKNIAKSIIVEKDDEAPAVEMPANAAEKL